MIVWHYTFIYISILLTVPQCIAHCKYQCQNIKAWLIAVIVNCNCKHVSCASSVSSTQCSSLLSPLAILILIYIYNKKKHFCFNNKHQNPKLMENSSCQYWTEVESATRNKLWSYHLNTSFVCTHFTCCLN